TGDRVAKLQAALKIKGFYKGPVDGDYGQGTANAVLAFQKSAGLSASGTANAATVRRLFGASSGETPARDDPAMAGITRISQISVPNTCAPGDSGRHVKALQQALKIKGYYKAMVDSSYGDQTEDAVRRYQKAVGLGADGVAGFSTIRKPFGKNAANYTVPTERLDWFRDGNSVLPKGTVFEVKDIVTGRTFTARRWSGANHVDAEPVSDGDGATLKAISGGFSWRRRAVLVKVGGKVYAGSINTMPHGTDTISGNEFKGHFCLHFYKSKTHGTDRVDQAHQDAVARAMRAEW
ncbi:MAG TPA: peptidoglycan-binding protein, partial [Candidatus Limnocylindria bacterium]|nr:peptidoglycan-binding protein [Candidatus Limnocylindria bacterium]